MLRLRITYDKEADALAIDLADAEVEKTRNIAPGVEADFDSTGRVVAIEFIHPTKSYDWDWSDFETPGRYYTLAEAAEISDISPGTFRHQIQRGVLRGKKIGHSWVVHIDDLHDYLAEHSRKARARKLAHSPVPL